MKDVVISRGWRLSHTCNCGGIRNEVFKKNGHKIKINKNGFILVYGSKNIGGKEDQIIEILDRYGL